MIPELNFDPAKPFFGLVYSYLCALHGHLELCSRHLAKETHQLVKQDGDLAKLIAGIEGKKTQERLPAISRGEVTVLLDDLALLCKIDGRSIPIDTDDLAATTVNQHSIVFQEFITQAASSLLILAWEMTTESHTHEPDWEFLRHCRNASAHNGRFHFLNGEPRRSAIWRALEIKPEMEGKNIFRIESEVPFLGPGDVLLLLNDLEKKLL